MEETDPGTGSILSDPSVEGDSDYVALEPWEEVVGQLERFHEDSGFIEITLDIGTLRFPVHSRGAAICEAELAGQEGVRVSILRTRSIEAPLQIRIL